MRSGRMNWWGMQLVWEARGLGFWWGDLMEGDHLKDKDNIKMDI
jgi:hypothetical protein